MDVTSFRVVVLLKIRDLKGQKMYVHFQRLYTKRLNPFCSIQLVVEPTDQNLIEVPKVVKPTNKQIL